MDSEFIERTRIFNTMCKFYRNFGHELEIEHMGNSQRVEKIKVK